MPSMKKEYQARVKYPFNNDTLIKAIPTSVTTLVTQCSAVKDHYFSRFKLEAKRATATRDNLKGVIRRIIAEREVSDKGGTIEQEILKSLSKNYDKEIILSLINKLSEAIDKGWSLRIGSKESLMGRFTTYIVAAYDLSLYKDGTLKLFRLSKSGVITASADTRLIYLLLPFQKDYVEVCEYIHYPIKELTDGGKDRGDLKFTLNRKDLTEAPGVTVKKIICKLAELKRNKGSECEKCPHTPYCPVLRDQIKEKAHAKEDSQS